MVLRHLAVALVAHERRLRREGSPPPPPLVGDLAQFLRDCVSIRHDATGMDGLDGDHDHVAVGVLLVTKVEVATVLSVSIRTVERLIAAGRLPVVHVEGATRIRVEDLNTYVQGLTGGPSPEPGGQPMPNGECDRTEPAPVDPSHAPTTRSEDTAGEAGTRGGDR